MGRIYRIKTKKLESGERFPFLVDAGSGIPLFEATVFTLTEFRAIGRATATIEQVLRSLKVWHLFCDAADVDLEVRMREGRLLELGEIDAVVQECMRPLVDMKVSDVACPVAPSAAATSLEAYRGRPAAAPVAIQSDSAGVRIRYIRQFIGWLVDRRLASLRKHDATYLALVSSRQTVIDGLTARIPTLRGLNKNSHRRAIDEKDQDRLWEIVNPDSPENPWAGRHARLRNELIVRYFMGLGIRRGELLGIRVKDVNFTSNEVFIARRADDKSDPRVVQPNAKTSDRLLPINDDLARRTRDYVINERRQYPKARKHQFLFIANGGAPLSSRGVNKIFSVLSDKHPELPHIFPHLFRHTHNFNFSNVADERGMSTEKEKKTRSQLMGWSETSKSAETYTMREIEREARQASLQIQQKMVKPIDGSN